MRLLMIEDDAQLVRAVLPALERAGFQTLSCLSGDEGLVEALKGTYDLVLLDRMLPGRDGVSVARAMRAAGVMTPIIMLTALGGLGDRVDGLDAGADDYLVKPFAMDELLARLRALMRRPRAWTPDRTVTFGDVTLAPDTRLLTGPDGMCPLSQRECDLMDALMHAGGQTAARQALFGRVWGEAEVEDGNLDSYIHFLRRRLCAVGSGVKLKTVYGVGYQLCF